MFFFEFFPDFQKRGLPWEKAFFRILQSVESRFVKNRSFRENSRKFRAAGATAPLPHPVLSISDFFENFTIFTHFLLGFKRKMLIFAEWNLPQRFFRARLAFWEKKTEILENRVGKIAFSKVQGHILGLFARDGPRFFSIFFLEKSGFFLEKKSLAARRKC